MRTYDIPYVKQGQKNYYPPIDYEKLGIEELIEKFIKTCGKANGKVSVCSKCDSPCNYGKRAVQLVANKIYDNPPVPLYGGKTLIECAREENIKRRKELEANKDKEIVNKEADKKDDKRANNKKIVEWYQKAYESNEPLKYIMKIFNISEQRAKQKVYSYQHDHPELRETMPLWTPSKLGRKPNAEKKIENSSSIKDIKEEKPSRNSDIAIESLEAKLDVLMKQADEYKRKAEEYQKLYQETKTKVDTIFSALNILDE